MSPVEKGQNKTSETLKIKFPMCHSRKMGKIRHRIRKKLRFRCFLCFLGLKEDIFDLLILLILFILLIILLSSTPHG